MASRKDVIMAGFERDSAKEDLKEEQKIRKSKAIRAMDTVTAMSEGAQAGMAIGEGVEALGTTAKNMKAKFAMRRSAKEQFMAKAGKSNWTEKMGKKAWKRNEGGRKGYKAEVAKWDQDKMSKDELVSMYVEGLNFKQGQIDANGQFHIVDDVDKGNNKNANDYQGVDGEPSFLDKTLDVVSGLSDDAGTYEDLAKTLDVSIGFGKAGFSTLDNAAKMYDWGESKIIGGLAGLWKKAREKKKLKKSGGGGAG